ncbi:bifunctional glutamine-synthetase adenylyltransferase/deadenyltransferase [Boudabousia liubingyangii]|uniref:Bifunctional glutamine-synthetase adenylyltransferase/deadenyltransferase n=1 Tax=Boudabousia liubingyangii TaxID=1921764 RepID=A0A1Q5PNB2_9ACTO|nr:bifunctional [glutamine synthetase] adenylyltransferase/[glutamine synthetase]-adenylyl-L-tyrosine phosphorylase [Boudabousia liubingyangii]OKL49019.1 bifunctional glutamine-synthetase adenylyltransferase/deadenyltransferase [Boudabousia liubingyangii]
MEACDLSLSDLSSLGFSRPQTAKQQLGDPGLDFPLAQIQIFSHCADPDAALVSLLNFSAQNPGPWQAIKTKTEELAAFLRLLGASEALGQMIQSDPSLLAHLAVPNLHQVHPPTAQVEEPAANPIELPETEVLDPGYRQIFIDFFSANRGSDPDTFRRCYYALLIEIATLDLNSPDPRAYLPTVCRQVSALADAALEMAMEQTRTQVELPEGLELAIIALGKCGAQELNYLSDVDVMFVVDWDREKTVENEALAAASNWVSAISTLIAGPGKLRPLWPLDLGLRPEGANGALVRTLDSYRSYYQRWAQSWEFQALLKARPAAGNPRLGQGFMELTQELVWTASARADFVDNARTMRQRVEANLRFDERDRHLKLGPGGLRDVEFSVQLLQLVHGRVDQKVRVPATLSALSALSAQGYIGRQAAQTMDQAYRELRLVEHRLQLHKLKRSHVLPKDAKSWRRLARACQVEGAEESSFEQHIAKLRSEVRACHQSLFYRPLLGNLAGLDDGALALSPEAATDWLAALGYRDPAGAQRQIAALTRGVTRRANIQRQILPVMLGWLANGPNPDQGLLRLRVLAEEVGSTGWFVRSLRDSPYTAKRLSQVLSSSEYATTAMINAPILVEQLDNDQALQITNWPKLESEVRSLVERQEDHAQGGARLRAWRARELGRAALADICLGMDCARSGQEISAANDATLRVTLDLARENIPRGFEVPIEIITMGRLGGQECGYASDADIILLHEDAGLPAEEAAQIAQQVAVELRNLLQADPSRLMVDYDLRPEGKQGPLSPSLRGVREYYHKWASTWERQALLRARPLNPDSQLAQDFLAAVDPIRYGSDFGTKELREVRLLKARMERERLPRSVPSHRHVKLGPGGLSDIEWTVQLLQLQNAHALSELRTTSTLGALKAARNAGLVSTEQARDLELAWRFASAVRAGNTLATGRINGQALDQLPKDAATERSVARILGYAAGQEHQLEEDYLRSARHARQIYEEIFVGGGH